MHISNEESELLAQITKLSHEFGTSDYVCGGGGNTSVKTDKTMWVKPSGITLIGIKPQDFVAMERQKLAELYAIKTPSTSAEREALVKDMMMKAVYPQSKGRPSVEAPLHNCLNAKFVVHTHPALVNGMTCSKNGREVCNKNFPQAMWLEYCDPGYTLSMRIRDEIKIFKETKGLEPSVIFLKNHGIFVAGNTPQEIHQIYSNILAKLKELYKTAQINLELTIAANPDKDAAKKAHEQIKTAVGETNAAFICSRGHFDYVNGPLTPDHIVYAKSYMFIGMPTKESISQFTKKYGYIPAVIVWDKAIYSIGSTQKNAELAMELAQDAAKIKQLSKAFGGIELMTEQAQQFIEGWEVEAFRKKQLQ